MTRHLLWLAGTLVNFLPIPMAAAVTPLIPIEQVSADYVRPHNLVDVGNGRRMNLYCRGEGAITVIFDSGLSDWSYVWALVQPAVATRTRACSYDRAGIGYSDPSPRPSSPINIVDDLHTLLEAAGIQGQLVLVGHSLGGFNMKLYAATYPSQVVGLVLVDPSEESAKTRIGAIERTRFGNDLVTRFQEEQASRTADYSSHLTVCAEKVRTYNHDPASDMYKGCINSADTGPIVPLGHAISAEFEMIQTNPAFQAAQASELINSIYGSAAQANAYYAKLLGGKYPLSNKPLIVLTHGVFDMSGPYGEIQFFEISNLHRQTAALSTRGKSRIVPATHHYIQIDSPQAVVDAIDEVLNDLKSAVAAY